MYKSIVIVILISLQICSSLLGQKLLRGDSIPEFSFVDIKGIQYGNERFLHKKLLITFLGDPSRTSSFFRLLELKEEYNQLITDNFEVVVVFEYQTELLIKLADDENIPFILVSDPELHLHTIFGVKKSIGKAINSVFKLASNKVLNQGNKVRSNSLHKRTKSLFRISSEFILKENKIFEAHYGKYIGDYLPMYRINQF